MSGSGARAEAKKGRNTWLNNIGRTMKTMTHVHPVNWPPELGWLRVMDVLTRSAYIIGIAKRIAPKSPGRAHRLECVYYGNRGVDRTTGPECRVWNIILRTKRW